MHRYTRINNIFNEDDPSEENRAYFIKGTAYLSMSESTQRREHKKSSRFGWTNHLKAVAVKKLAVFIFI